MKRLPNATCFISYAHSGMDMDTFQYVIETIKDALSNRVKIFWDRQTSYGKNFHEFMELVTAVQTVIVILTPEYKKRVYTRNGGVYEEFTMIWQRYSEESDSVETKKSLDNTIRKFEIIPILFSGTGEDAIPDEIKALNYLDLTHFRVKRQKNGEYSVTRKDKDTIVPKLTDLASQILASAVLNADEYRKLSETDFDDLFVDLKASWDRTIDGRNLPSTQFVKTRSYYKIESQQAYFAVGRKGSGKSTLSQIVPQMQANRYKDVIRIEANEFNLEALYSLYSDPQFRSDTSTIIPRQKAFEFTWEAVIMLALMDKLLTMEWIQSQRGLLKPIARFMSRLKNSHSKNDVWLTSDYFGYCFQSIVKFTKECIDNATEKPEMFYTDITRAFKLERFLWFAFGEDVCETLNSLVMMVDQKFLITLDGFDTAFDEFRVNSIRTDDPSNLQKRAYFEIDWLRSLLSLAIRMKSPNESKFYSALDFCLVAPMDRFMEVVRIERDSYRNWSRWFTIQWTGIELAILVRKRLEGLVKSQTNDSLSPEQRLQEILAHKQYKHIPYLIEFEFNEQNYSIELFMYILRHTFWRPREVLYYYARIINLADSFKRWDTPITSEAIRKCIKATTSQIVESEFIEELRSTVVNIESIISVFRKQKSHLDFQTIKSLISNRTFKFATGDLPQNDIVGKTRFLYSIGFIGIKLNSDERTRLGLWHEDVFYFNEGHGIFDDNYLNEDDLAPLTYIIHPIFCEYLRLDTSNSSMPLIFDWKYLRDAEAALMARQ
jgi:energy-coupling factor transporter ATP-binding protein EcfA2